MKYTDLSETLQESLDALEALSEEGLMVVPTVPTPEMISAAMRVSDLTEEEVRKIYYAMITFSDEDFILSRN